MQLYTKFHKKIVYSRVVCYRALIPLKCALFWCRCLLMMHFGTACFGLGGFLLFEIREPACIAAILIHIKCPLVQMHASWCKEFFGWNAFCFWDIRSSKRSVFLILTKCFLMQRHLWHCLLWFWFRCFCDICAFEILEQACVTVCFWKITENVV